MAPTRRGRRNGVGGSPVVGRAQGKKAEMSKPASSTINIQDPYFYQLRKEARTVHIYLISGKRLTGILRRFDRYAVVLENHGQEQLVYKHAVASISAAVGGAGGHPNAPQQDENGSD